MDAATIAAPANPSYPANALNTLNNYIDPMH